MIRWTPTGPQDSVSAAETFTMALMGCSPEVLRIGANTHGARFPRMADNNEQPYPSPATLKMIRARGFSARKNCAGILKGGRSIKLSKVSMFIEIFRIQDLPASSFRRVQFLSQYLPACGARERCFNKLLYQGVETVRIGGRRPMGLAGQNGQMSLRQVLEYFQ